MKGIYWSYDSWGAQVPPLNWEDVCYEGNRQIDEYIEGHPGVEEDDIRVFVEEQWEEFCHTGVIGHVVADYEDEEGRKC